MAHDSDQIDLIGIRTIVVGNNREFFTALDRYVSHDDLPEFIQSDVDEADMDILWPGDNKIVIVPQPIDQEFIADSCRLFNFQNAHVRHPRVTRASLCEDILDDRDLCQMLVNCLRSSEGVRIISWGYTVQFQELLNYLGREGLNFSAPEIPPYRARWTARYFDTKIGSRDLVSRAKLRMPKLRLPEGFICANSSDALLVAEHVVESGKGVVLKANEGCAGLGVVILQAASFGTDPEANTARLSNAIAGNPFLQKGPILVEEYVTPDTSQFAAYPSIDVLIGIDGIPVVQSLNAIATQVTSVAPDVHSTLTGVGLFTEEQRNELHEMGMAIGEELSGLGYRGWFDVDLIRARSGELFVTECNLRRTSICHMLGLANSQFNREFERQVAMRSNDGFSRLELKDFTYHDVKRILAPLLFPMAEGQRGVVLTQSFRSMFGRGKLGYICVGHNQNDALALEKQLENLLGNSRFFTMHKR